MGSEEDSLHLGRSLVSKDGRMLRIVQSPPDGNCLFSALGAAVGLAQHEVRAAVARLVCAHWELFQGAVHVVHGHAGVEDADADTGNSVEADGGRRTLSSSEYTGLMLEDGTAAGAPELLAAAEAFGMDVVVLVNAGAAVAGQVYRFTSKDPVQKEILLLFSESSGSGHYDLLTLLGLPGTPADAPFRLAPPSLLKSCAEQRVVTRENLLQRIGDGEQPVMLGGGKGKRNKTPSSRSGKGNEMAKPGQAASNEGTVPAAVSSEKNKTTSNEDVSTGDTSASSCSALTQFKKLSPKAMYMKFSAELKECVSNNNLKAFVKLFEMSGDLTSCYWKDNVSSFYIDEENELLGTNPIILSCKLGRPKILKYLLREGHLNKLCSNLGAEQAHPESVDEFNHNAIHYAILSKNEETFDILTNDWREFNEMPKIKQMSLISECYNTLYIKGVALSSTMEFRVNDMLTDYNFFHDSELTKPNLVVDEIVARIDLLLDSVTDVVSGHGDSSKPVDSKMLYHVRFIAKNLHVLRRQLRSTYKVLPWEELEFCLVIFLLRYHKGDKTYFGLMTAEKVCKFLFIFSKCLKEIKNALSLQNPRSLRELPKVDNRDKLKVAVLRRTPEFQDLYDTFNLVKDSHSLEKILQCVNLSLHADHSSKEGQLQVIRALQIIGEHVKNTVESPKLSTDTQLEMETLTPRDSLFTLKKLRNKLSRALPLFGSDEDTESNEDLFRNVQNDLLKFQKAVTYMLCKKQMRTLQILVEEILLNGAVEDWKAFGQLLKQVAFQDELYKSHTYSDFVPAELEKARELVGHLTEVVRNTPKAFTKLNWVNIIIENAQNESKLLASKYHMLSMQLCLALKHGDIGNTASDQRQVKNVGTQVLDAISREDKEDPNIEMVMAILQDVLLSADSSQVHHIGNLIEDFYYDCCVNRDKIRWIDFANTETIEEAGVAKKEAIDVEKKVKTLEDVLKDNGLGRRKYVSDLSAFAKNKGLQHTLETLVFDVLESVHGNLSHNMLCFESPVPSLLGRELRNHLAHDNSITSLLPFRNYYSTLSNARHLVAHGTEVVKGERKLGKIVVKDSGVLRDLYNRDVAAVTIQSELFSSLTRGNFKAAMRCIQQGGDIKGKSGGSGTLHFASVGGNLSLVKYLIENGADVQDVDRAGNLPLHIASLHGWKDLVVFLLSAANINQGNQLGKSPLHMAVQGGHVEVVRILLERNADPTSRLLTGQTALQYAVHYNRPEIVRILLENCSARQVREDDTGGGLTALHTAAELGSLELTKLLVGHGANVNAASDRDETPLHGAVAEGHLETARILVERGAKVDVQDYDGRTPLHHAALRGHKALVDLLLDSGARVATADKKNRSTALHHAAFSGQVDVVRSLVRKGADVEAATTEEMTPLHFAARRGHLGVVQLLLEQGACPRRVDIAGNSALHHCCSTSGAGRADVATVLLENGADVNFQAGDGKTSLHLAATLGDEDMVRLLLKYGADVAVADDRHALTPLLSLTRVGGSRAVAELLLKAGADVAASATDGSTPMHFAAEFGFLGVLEALVENGAEVDCKTPFGETPLFHASGHKQCDVLRFLLERGAGPDARRCDGLNALFAAAGEGPEEAVRTLLKAGADANAESASGNTALVNAATRNQLKISKLLMEHGAHVTVKALRAAIGTGNARMLSALLDRGAFNLEDCSTGATLLHFACKSGHSDCVKLLLEKGADVNARTKYPGGTDSGQTPLHLAARQGYSDVISLLIQKRADVTAVDEMRRTPLHCCVTSPNALDCAKELRVAMSARDFNVTMAPHKLTPLHLAASEGISEMVKYLLANGADVNAADDTRAKPIHHAASQGHTGIVKLFLEKVNLNNSDRAETPLLHRCAQAGLVDIIKVLAERGVDLNATDKLKRTAVHVASANDQTEALHTLLKLGAVYDNVDLSGKKAEDVAVNDKAKLALIWTRQLFSAVEQNDAAKAKKAMDFGALVHSRNSSRVTPLMLAVYWGLSDVCSVLLAEADPNVADDEGYTPLHHAAKHGQVLIARLLLSKGAFYDAASTDGVTPFRCAKKSRAVQDMLKLVSSAFRKVSVRDRSVVEDFLGEFQSDSPTGALLNARRKSDGLSVLDLAARTKLPDREQLQIVGRGYAYEMHFLKAVKLFEGKMYAEAESILKSTMGCISRFSSASLCPTHRLAEVLYAQGKLHEALAWSKECCEVAEKCEGPRSQYVFLAKDTQYRCLRDLGMLGEALQLAKGLYADRVDVLGCDHEETMASLNGLATVLTAMGKLGEALPKFQLAHARLVSKYGTDHPIALRMLNNIGSIYLQQGDKERALSVTKEVYEKRLKILGPDDNETVRARQNLSAAYSQLGQYTEASKMTESVLHAQRTTLGAHHPDSLVCMLSIAGDAFRHGQLKRALKVLEDFTEGCPPVWGEDHLNRQKAKAYVTLCTIQLELQTRVQWFEYMRIAEEMKKEAEGLASDRLSRVTWSTAAEGINDPINPQEGITQLHEAVSFLNGNNVDFLLMNGADPTRKTCKGNTALHIAVLRGDREIVTKLLEHVKSKTPRRLASFVDAKTYSGGTTCLHVAAMNGSIELATCLLRYGATYDAKNAKGETPLDVCSPSGVEVRSLLERIQGMFSSVQSGEAGIDWAPNEMSAAARAAALGSRNRQGDCLGKLWDALRSRPKSVQVHPDDPVVCEAMSYFSLREDVESD